ncbi:TPA: histidine kinase [Clostridium botulinum]|uniref:histidine kinase n=1 Tax=Clostridium botulinum TaxID=1491 RepID=UPI000D0CD9DE|nr:histidine kinase [Clostridium botulinum]PSL96337.1 histidine kinase [Clostridium botulinum]HDK7140053.1 histidine kinase [Clostridium botulinum]HDK7143641.1 histidine kinase [Clostridium botulinum]HDK7147287.1 histidine kinase [Clostridium botulinum]HDK7151029.1 histidine kinase [Clostridium botulinum]
MNKLLTQKDLAERWQVSIRAIENWRKDGIITPVDGIPSIRFNPQHIAELEGTKLERFSPLERKKFEIENERLKKENEKLKGIIANVLCETSKVINL